MSASRTANLNDAAAFAAARRLLNNISVIGEAQPIDASLSEGVEKWPPT